MYFLRFITNVYIWNQSSTLINGNIKKYKIPLYIYNNLYNNNYWNHDLQVEK